MSAGKTGRLLRPAAISLQSPAMTRPPYSLVVGVDFSAGLEAGRKVWVTTCQIDTQNRLSVQSVTRADQLPNSGLDRAAAHAGVVGYLLSLDNALVGLDFPLAVPAKLIPAGSNWKLWLTGLKSAHADADAFREDLVSRSAGKEHKRACETAAKTPFASYNLRMYMQTYFGLTDVVCPLLASGKYHALPFEPASQNAEQPTNTLIEACPASYLKSVGMYLSYKGQSTSQLAARHKIYEHLIDAGLLNEPDEDNLRSAIVSDEAGDALDSLLCAVCAIKALNTQTLTETPGELELTEGRVYF
jgi:hypothetical protein